jgi:hypothetical protein
MTTARKLFYYNGGFLHQKQLRRIMSLAGYKLTLACRIPGIWWRSGGKAQTSIVVNGWRKSAKWGC